jgi:hypothetical protein
MPYRAGEYEEERSGKKGETGENPHAEIRKKSDI